jgi:anthranilate/para-aminobenzoate synthase component II
MQSDQYHIFLLHKGQDILTLKLLTFGKYIDILGISVGTQAVCLLTGAAITV